MFLCFYSWHLTYKSFIVIYGIKNESLKDILPELDENSLEAHLTLGDDNSDKHVFYWAANPQKDIHKILGPEEAYGDYENHGLLKCDDKGEVINLSNGLEARYFMSVILDHSFQAWAFACNGLYYLSSSTAFRSSSFSLFWRSFVLCLLLQPVALAAWLLLVNLLYSSTVKHNKLFF